MTFEKLLFIVRGMDTNAELALQTLELAVSLCKTKAEFARRIRRSPQEVWNWVHRDRRAPVDACPFIVAACKHPEVTLEGLRPDYQGWALVIGRNHAIAD
ncbi:helix-turn-helix domain-containing protein [Cupriavidus metallidurans]|nr:helix-turn-helix domain-containing protein [Cupriavidus metallidurans]